MKLVFAVDHTTRDGVTYKQGETKEVSYQDAGLLVFKGIAAPAPTKSTKSDTTAASK